MPMKFKSNKEMFHFVADKGVGLTHAQGYHWYWKKLIPAFEKAVRTHKIPKKFIADCYYVFGDVHDFNNAPKAAIRCYEEALKVDPEMGTAHREIANMYGQMGDFDRALLHSDKALALLPSDKFAISDRREYIGESNRIPKELFENQNAIWAAYEHLAVNDPSAAIDVLKRKKGWAAKRARIHCYGALRETKKYLDGWKELSKNQDEIEFTHADWFFMCDDVFMEPDLWEILWGSNAKFSGYFTVFEGLDESDLYCSLSSHEKIRLRLEYYCYAQADDSAGLKRLNEKYPEWVELRDNLEQD